MSIQTFADSTGLIAPDGRPIGTTTRWGFDEENDTKEMIFRELGPIEDVAELFHNDVLVWKYKRTKVSDNLLASHYTENADRWEGVIGLVLALGPAAFLDDEHNKFYGKRVVPGDWALFRNSDGWDKNIQILDTSRYCECRIIQDAHIRGRVKYPARML